MQNTYTTKTKVSGNHCVIEVYINESWWHTYDFHLNQLYFINGRNIFSDLGTKNWGTAENIAEIHNAVMKHLLSYYHV